jgi:hypothetical protein
LAPPKPKIVDLDAGSEEKQLDTRGEQNGSQKRASHHSFDDLVGPRYHCWWDINTERLGCSEVYCEFEFGRLNDRQIGGLLSLQDATDI